VSPGGTVAYISLGSNLGDRAANLRLAARHLERVFGAAEVSAVYETAPWGPVAQPDYLNQVARVTAPSGARSTLAELQKIEAAMGRRQSVRYGPRVIDLDLLLFGDAVVDEPGLQLPHPRLGQRAFVLAPLADVAAGLVVPLTGGRTVADLLAAVDCAGVRRYAPSPERPE
jgi:2-amino-4-hydroxy-6-hydroxymethyldihydropteridine diphosphokinase